MSHKHALARWYGISLMKRFRGGLMCAVLLGLTIYTSGCSKTSATVPAGQVPGLATPSPASHTATPASQAAVPLTPDATTWVETKDHVTLSKSTITWQTYAYTLKADNTLASHSFDRAGIVRRTFKTWILENQFLKVTLLPEFGGRLLSIVYKATGHEELYQNPVGTPYIIGQGTFYYDWLMIYGGIFPTFPEPEHGKTWLLPWKFAVLTQTDNEVSVAMSVTDTIDNATAPPRFNIGAIGLQTRLVVSLKAGRAAVDTSVE